MVFDISKLILWGEIYHTRPYSLHGAIMLRGMDDPAAIDLTGAPAEDLIGRAIEFKVPVNDVPPTDEDRKLARSFKNQQVGATGSMTSVRKTAKKDPPTPGSTSSAGGQPEQYLHMEWFSQNGHVVLNLASLELRFIEHPRSESSIEFIEVDMDARSEEEIDESGEDEESEEIAGLDIPSSEDEVSGDEGYGLVPDELNREFERSARRLDLEMRGKSEEEIRSMEELMMVDDLIENGEGVPIPELTTLLRLPPPSSLATESEAESTLKAALSLLALYGISFHICKHCSMQEAYRIFAEKICKECTVYPEMRGTEWVQHFTTSDFCKGCDGEDVEPEAPG